MPDSKQANNTSPTSASSSSKDELDLTNPNAEGKSKQRTTLPRLNSRPDHLAQVLACKRLAKMPMVFLAKRRQMRKISLENPDGGYSDDNAKLIATLSTKNFEFENEAQTFEEYTQKLEEALIILRTMKRDDYESQTAIKVLHFLENLIHQPKEWISGAKLKLSEMKFPETAMTLMLSYKEKGHLIQRNVFFHSILLCNSVTTFTDHEFDKEGLIRKQAADAGFIEFACQLLSDPFYREALKKCYTIKSPEETMVNVDFNNYQKILSICDSSLTILYNMANLPELKIHFRECNAINVVAEYTKLPQNAVVIQFSETSANHEYTTSCKEFQETVRAIRVTSCLLLPLIMNEDEDNILAANTSEVLPILSGMIQMYNQNDQRFYGFSFIELVDGLSKLMVLGGTHKYIDQDLVNILLNILENKDHEEALLECVSNALLNASFDEKVQKLLDTEQAIEVITSARDHSQSQLVQKNCQAILWTLNRIQHRGVTNTTNSTGMEGHIMISYNRSVTAMCLKIRDRLKALRYSVWLDVDNIYGGVLESMADAVENSSIVLICMNEQYKQSYYCRLEAEYATELRKPCVPCLMQPRFRPYGWLGIIKGAKIHVDFATFPFEEAFSLLMREIGTIQRDNAIKAPTTGDNSPNTSYSPHGKKLSKANHVKNASEESVQFAAVKASDDTANKVSDWDVQGVNEWLERAGLANVQRAFLHVDGKLLNRLYQMKQSAPDSYYKFIDKYFDRVQIARMSDILLFDSELEKLFQ